MPALVERPKMSIAMWAALKNHIMRQREKKKQEQEADAATERVRRERELKRRQDAMTLEEIRDQVQQSEKKLVTLKEEKHQLFHAAQEGTARRRHPETGLSEGGQRDGSAQPLHLYIQDINRAHSMYKLAQPIPQNPSVLHRAPLKRPLTPSPPPSSQAATSSTSSSQQATPPQSGFSPQQPYAYKAQMPGSAAYGAPKLIPAYAPGHGPIYYAHVPGQGSVPAAMAPAAPALEPPHGLQKPRFHDEKFYVSQPSMLPMRTLASPAAQSAAMALASPQPKPSSYLTAAQQHQMAAAAAAAQRHPGYPGQPTRFY
ncbi:hypothetical protein MRX96_024661 [Rhipicephalus microplus]